MVAVPPFYWVKHCEELYLSSVIIRSFVIIVVFHLRGFLETYKKLPEFLEKKFFSSFLLFNSQGIELFKV